VFQFIIVYQVNTSSAIRLQYRC